MSLFKKKKDDDGTDPVLDIQDNPLPGDSENPEDSEGSETTENPEDPQEPESTELPNDSHDSLSPSDPVQRLAAAIRSELESGELSDDTRALLARALNYRDDMDRAMAEAELRGRNAAIEEHLLNMDHGDGIPHPGCGQGAPTASSHYSIFDLARSAK